MSCNVSAASHQRSVCLSAKWKTACLDRRVHGYLHRRGCRSHRLTFRIDCCSNDAERNPPPLDRTQILGLANQNRLVSVDRTLVTPEADRPAAQNPWRQFTLAHPVRAWMVRFAIVRCSVFEPIEPNYFTMVAASIRHHESATLNSIPSGFQRHDHAVVPAAAILVGKTKSRRRRVDTYFSKTHDRPSSSLKIAILPVERFSIDRPRRIITHFDEPTSARDHRTCRDRIDTFGSLERRIRIQHPQWRVTRCPNDSVTTAGFPIGVLAKFTGPMKPTVNKSGDKRSVFMGVRGRIGSAWWRACWPVQWSSPNPQDTPDSRGNLWLLSDDSRRDIPRRHVGYLIVFSYESDFFPTPPLGLCPFDATFDISLDQFTGSVCLALAHMSLSSPNTQADDAASGNAR